MSWVAYSSARESSYLRIVYVTLMCARINDWPDLFSSVSHELIEVFNDVVVALLVMLRVVRDCGVSGDSGQPSNLALAVHPDETMLTLPWRVSTCIRCVTRTASKYRVAHTLLMYLQTESLCVHHKESRVWRRCMYTSGQRSKLSSNNTRKF